MRMRFLLACLLLAGVVSAKRWIPASVVDDWRIEGGKLFVTGQPGGDMVPGMPILVPSLAARLGIKEEEVPAYLESLDPKLPLLVEYSGGTHVRSIRPLNEEQLRKELRLELTPALEVKLVNAGHATHRVVKPNDGSESGWREPEIYFEREVDGKWERGGKPGRCGLYAHEWQKDIVDLKPTEALPLEGFLLPEMAFGLAKGTKVKLRAVYVYRGGHGSKGAVGELNPGAMGKTPPFTLHSEPVEIELK